MRIRRNQQRVFIVFVFIFLLSLLCLLYHRHTDEGENESPRYFDSKQHLLNEVRAGHNYYILIAVISRAANFEARMDIRNSWALPEIEDRSPTSERQISFWNTSLGHHTGLPVRVVFIVARSTDSIIHHYVTQENHIFNDIVLGDFVDSYRNLPHKTLLLLQTFNQLYKGTKYIMKIDDNVRLNLALLFDVLISLPETDFVLGHVLNQTKPLRKHCSGKWYLSGEVYSSDTFPIYTSGPAYILTSNAARQILAVCPDANYKLHLEDVIFTGLCREMASIPIRDNVQICQGPEGREWDILCATEHKRLSDVQEKIRTIRQLSQYEM